MEPCQQEKLKENIYSKYIILNKEILNITFQFFVLKILLKIILLIELKCFLRKQNCITQQLYKSTINNNKYTWNSFNERKTLEFLYNLSVIKKIKELKKFLILILKIPKSLIFHSSQRQRNKKRIRNISNVLFKQSERKRQFPLLSTLSSVN